MPRRKITHNRKYGPGPSFVIRSLSSLAWDPESLERERRERFESSPSPTDDKDSSDDDTEEWPEGMTPPRATKEMERHEASIPQYQWIDHQDEEREWLLAMTDRTLGGYEYDDYELEWRVYDGVKDRWKEQGIWREKWEDEFMTEWAHEDPPDAGSGVVAGAGGPQQNPGHEFTLHPGRDASRPFYQFLYQLFVERGRIRAELDRHRQVSNWHSAMVDPNDPESFKKSTIPTPLDVNTNAYERVKRRWEDRGIWYKKWGEHMPGMQWKHEFELEEVLRGEARTEESPVMFETSPASYTSEMRDEEPWLRLYPTHWLPKFPRKARRSSVSTRTSRTHGFTIIQSPVPAHGSTALNSEPSSTHQSTPPSAARDNAGSSIQDAQSRWESTRPSRATSRAPTRARDANASSSQQRPETPVAPLEDVQTSRKQPSPSEDPHTAPSGTPEARASSLLQPTETSVPPLQARMDPEPLVDAPAPPRRSRRLQEKVENITAQTAADIGDGGQQPKHVKSCRKRTAAASAAADNEGDGGPEEKPDKSRGKRAASANAVEPSGRASKKRKTSRRK